MIRPVIRQPNKRRKLRQSSLGLGSVFKSILESFRAQSQLSKHNKLPIIINPTVVGGTADQQLLFKKIRSASPELRLEALIELTASIEEFSISSIPEIWYAAKDLLLLPEGDETRINCLKLLLSCIKHDDLDSSAVRLTYYDDIMTHCKTNYPEKKLDSEFSLFLQCLEALTLDGTNIQDFYLNEKYPLQHFLSIGILLSHSQISSLSSPQAEQDLEQLTEFTRNCIAHNTNLIDENSISMLAQQLISLALSCPSASVMRSILILLDLLAAEGISLAQSHRLVELLSYTYCLEQEVTWSVVSSLLKQSVYCETALSSLCDLVLMKKLSRDFSHEVQITISIGAVDILSRIRKELVSLSVTEAIENATHLVICSMFEASSKGDIGLNIRLVNLLQTIVDVDPRSLYYEDWFCEDSGFGIIENVSTAMEGVPELRSVVSSLISSISKLSMGDNFTGNTKQLIFFFCTHLNIVSETELILILDYMRSPFGLYNLMSYSESMETLLKVLTHEHCQKSVELRIETVNLIRETVLQNVESEHSCDTDVRFFQKLQLIMLQELNDEVLMQLTQSDYLIQLTLTATSAKFQALIELVVEYFEKTQSNDQQIQIAKTLCKLYVLVSIKTHDRDKSLFLYDTLIAMARTGLKALNFNVVLVISKMMVRIRINKHGQMLFTNPGDIEGLSAAFNRNFTGRVETASADLAWIYPETIDYLPHELIDVGSRVIKNFVLKDWLSFLVEIMENFYDWELYSFAWSHICPQLSNLGLFLSPIPKQEEIQNISRLRMVICDQLSSRLPPLLKFPESLTKADLQIAMIRTLTALIAYHDLFSKNDEDSIISATVEGLSTSWEKTAIPAIHFLNIACYEIPLSVKKYLALILIKLQTRITSFFASPHILEFLMALSHLPSLSSNFNLDEYKRIFGICFQFIEFYKINKTRNLKHADEVFINKHGEDVKVENVPSTELINITPALSQYLLRLSYSVISSWFLKMKPIERRELEPFIVRNLMLSSKIDGGDDPDDQTVGFLDFVARFSLFNTDLVMDRDLAGDSKYVISRWLYLRSVISIMTNEEECKIHVRKPADSVIMRSNTTNPKIKDLHREISVDVIKEEFSSKGSILNYVFPESRYEFKLLTNDLSTVRSLHNLDRLPIVQLCKAGIIYIGPGQNLETEILSNQFGSVQYQDFLSKVGEFIRLRDCQSVYTGGLDTENDMDGKFAIFWRDEITQLVFHTTTLMPNNSANDPHFSLKKRHVGNNYVNIYFDESGLEFDFNVLKSQFNFLNIVITPISSDYYRVKIYRRNGVPLIFAACHFKLISGSRLATLVRNLALVCYEFSDVWNCEGQFIGNWSRRAQHIAKLELFLDTGIDEA